jgi:hypothetical protein
MGPSVTLKAADVPKDRRPSHGLVRSESLMNQNTKRQSRGDIGAIPPETPASITQVVSLGYLAGGLKI